MKAIIITNTEAQALVDRLKLEESRQRAAIPQVLVSGEDMAKNKILTEIHRHFHYEVARWLQEMGADIR